MSPGRSTGSHKEGKRTSSKVVVQGVVTYLELPCASKTPTLPPSRRKSSRTAATWCNRRQMARTSLGLWNWALGRHSCCDKVESSVRALQSYQLVTAPPYNRHIQVYMYIHIHIIFIYIHRILVEGKMQLHVQYIGRLRLAGGSSQAIRVHLSFVEHSSGCRRFE